jgi:hypothetical protein
MHDRRLYVVNSLRNNTLLHRQQHEICEENNYTSSWQISTFIHIVVTAWYSDYSQADEPQSNHVPGHVLNLWSEALLHELAGHVEKTTNATGRATRGTTTAATLEVHLECHLCCRGDNVLLVSAAGSIAVGVLLVCDIVSYFDSSSLTVKRKSTYRTV